MQDRRTAIRMDINVKMKLNCVKTEDTHNLKTEEFEVELVNISETGLAFLSAEALSSNTYYDARIVLWTKDSFDSVIEIIRKERKNDSFSLYGCRFIGLGPSDQFKIQVYELLKENERLNQTV